MTDSSSPVMAASYDPLQVALSVLIAIAASYAALSLAGRVTATRNGARALWLAGGATSMGSGIWAMHFVGMLAFHLPIAVAYDTPTILVALFLAIVASATALYVVSRRRMGIRYALISGGILGCGVAALHFLGMMAMRMAAAYTLNAGVVAASVLLGIAFAAGGMWLGYYFREEPKRTAWKRLGAGLLMGTAISAMHYTAMASARFTSATPPLHLEHTVTVSTLGTLGIASVILVLLGATILSCRVDRRFDAQGTELAVAEAKMEFAQSARLTVMGELTASIAHEIKQPLAAIVTNGNYCLRQLATATPNLKEVRQAIQDIVEDGNRTSSIISRIRALLLKGAPERVDLDMNQVIRDVAYFVRAEVEENGIILKLDLAADLPRALGDQVQLQQALMNVIINSVEALRAAPQPHRELLLRSRKIPEGALIEVKDSGPGLIPAVSERLFEPFFTTKTEGMGLGLSISRSIIESHGGSLSNIEATYGAHFAFIIPESPKSSQD
jgi:two-component system, sensor histidine kinase and response regulator